MSGGGKFDNYSDESLMDYIIRESGKSRFYFKGGHNDTRHVTHLPRKQLLAIAQKIEEGGFGKKKAKKKEQNHQMTIDEIMPSHPMSKAEIRAAITKCYEILA